MPDLLDTFLESHAALPWAWGSVDCSLVLADWAIARGHDDPAADLRGAYDSELGWRRIVTARGGLLPLISDVCARAAIPAGANAVRGVVGVLGSARLPDRQWGVIFDGERWQLRGVGGFAPLTAPLLGMWSV